MSIDDYFPKGPVPKYGADPDFDPDPMQFDDDFDPDEPISLPDKITPEGLRGFFMDFLKIRDWVNWGPPKYSNEEIEEDLVMRYIIFSVRKEYTNPLFILDVKELLPMLEEKAEKFVLRLAPRRPYYLPHRQYFFQQVENKKLFHYGSNLGDARRKAIENIHASGLIDKRMYLTNPDMEYPTMYHPNIFW